MNLCDWIDSPTLVTWVEEVVYGTDWRALRVNQTDDEADFSPAAMLRVLVFAYATGLSDSEEIVRQCESDTLLNLLGDHRAPFPDEIMSFRRKHRELIARLLAQVFARAVQQTQGVQSRTPELEQQLMQQALDRLDLARHIDNQG